MKWTDRIRERKYQREKAYWRQCILDGGEHFPELGSDIWIDVPDEVYHQFFSDDELKQIELEMRYNDIVIRKMLEEMD